jgi:hypothetical protein
LERRQSFGDYKASQKVKRAAAAAAAVALKNFIFQPIGFGARER